METKNEKKIAVEQLKAMMAKVMPMLTAGEKIDLGMVFILSARENVYETKQAEMENGSTRREKLPDKSRQPTPPMMRRAIEKAFALETKDNKGRAKRVFNTKRKWLAVLRVLQYFGIVRGNKPYNDAENYIINKVYPNGVPIPEVMRDIMPNPNAMSKAGGEMALNRSLEDWLSGKYDEQLGDYLVIARCVLKSITDEMLPNPPKA